MLFRYESARRRNWMRPYCYRYRSECSQREIGRGLMMNNKICIIGVYFGELPNYVNLWMKSAAYNSLIDFYLVTDQIVENLPANVILISMSIEEVEALAAKKLEITDISIKYPYKCIEFKKRSNSHKNKKYKDTDSIVDHGIIHRL